ncbi:MAG: hypothetical protein SGARI_000283 [Bacillariaceae sp.]
MVMEMHDVQANFLFVPIFNIDEKFSCATRVSNCSTKNRAYLSSEDFGKLDAIETRAVVKVMNDYDVAFYTDLHSTDGMNYQPDVTWCDNGDAGLSNGIYAWLRSEMQPALEDFVRQYNHIPAVCYYANDPMDPTADHRHIPAYLLEIHSLKPNKQRVLGAYAFLYGLLTIVGEKKDSLKTAMAADKAARVDPVPIAWDYDDPPPMVEWPIFNYSIVTNPILGIDQIIWTDEPLTITVEQSTRSTPLNPPTRPFAYIIPAQWTEVIERLALHGIELEVLTESADLTVTQYRVEDATVSRLREGRAETTGTNVPEDREVTYAVNDIVVRMDQPLGTLAVALMEPVGESSFFLWGFWNSVLTSHEYAENYIMIPLAEEMLSQSTELAAEWETYKAENPSYVNQTSDVVDWFFRRSAYYDDEAYLLPFGILYSEVELSTVSYMPEMENGGDSGETGGSGNGGCEEGSAAVVAGGIAGTMIAVGASMMMFAAAV